MTSNFCRDIQFASKREEKAFCNVIEMLKIALVAAFMVCLVGCGAVSKSETTVNGFCEAMKSLDADTMSQYVVGNDVSVLSDATDESETSDEDVAKMDECLMEYVGQMTYAIGESKKNGESVNVPVTFTYIDAEPVFNAAIEDYFSRAIMIAFTGGSTDEDVMNKLFASIFLDNAKSTETESSSIDVIFVCQKDGEEWKIANIDDCKDELMSVLTCNIIDAYNDFLDEMSLFEEIYDSDSANASN